MLFIYNKLQKSYLYRPMTFYICHDTVNIESGVSLSPLSAEGVVLMIYQEKELSETCTGG